ncbi:MAG: hypothetical protein LC744_08195 [Chloroflexi bacterium]|nr:hypothetical protein [Chloroflexota bacterium]
MARRALGWASIAYGIAGIALVLVGAIGGLEMADRIENLALRADSTLAAAQRATEATADSFTGVDKSLGEGEASADAAAVLAREASGTLRSLSLAMTISILGTQPLQPLAADFADSADQAAALAETLDGMGASLSDTRADMIAIGTRLDQLAVELDALRDASSTEGTAPPVRLFVTIVLVWLGLQALAAIIGGLTLLRTPREIVIEA